MQLTVTSPGNYTSDIYTGKYKDGAAHELARSLAQRSVCLLGLIRASLALLGSVALHTILSLMSPPLSPADQASAQDSHHPTGSRHFSSTLTIARSGSVLGYCLLPLVMTSLVGIAIPMDSLFGYVLTFAAIAWCTYSSSSMFCAVGRMSETKLLVAYPLGLFYAGFGIMAIFSSRGSGALQAKTTGG
jgi:hypothetical protein